MCIEQLKEEVKQELTSNILPFWMNKMVDDENGGFYGRIDGHNRLEKTAEKGAILNARILWTFSAAYRVLKDEAYRRTAERAKDYLLKYFLDKEFGGVYWMLDYQGRPVDTKKQIYAIGFAIYGLSEWVRATGDNEALQVAKELFGVIDKYSRDEVKSGYLEACTREWKELEDVRLSDKDENLKKTMNTHLHILEPYTNLYRVWKDEVLRARIVELIEIFCTKILDSNTYHLGLFFDENWNVSGAKQSFGHDIEASWLIHEAILTIGDAAVTAKYEPLIPLIARAADEGLNPDGSLIYEREGAEVDRELHWWVQAENVVGHLNLYQYFGDEEAKAIAVNCWQFIRTHLVDRQEGEWIWSILPDGSRNVSDDKAGFWKCPYHNGRMCLEIIERF